MNPTTRGYSKPTEDAKNYSDDDLEAMAVVCLAPPFVPRDVSSRKQEKCSCMSIFTTKTYKWPRFKAVHSVVQGQDVAKTQTTAQHQKINPLDSVRRILHA